MLPKMRSPASRSREDVAVVVELRSMAAVPMEHVRVVFCKVAMPSGAAEASTGT